jgi:hypothetical protein
MALKFNNLSAMVRKPHYATAGIFTTDHNLAWIPDSTLNFVTQEPADAANGVRTEFVFDGTPKFVVYNGQWRFENVGYTLSGNTVTLIGAGGGTITPDTGDDIRAIV